MPQLRFHFYTFLGSWPWCLGLAYLGMKAGEHWDYLVRPREGAVPLRVTTSPLDDIAVGASAWLEFEPRQMALIA